MNNEYTWGYAWGAAIKRRGLKRPGPKDGALQCNANHNVSISPFAQFA